MSVCCGGQETEEDDVRACEIERGGGGGAGGKGEGPRVVQTVAPCVPHTLSASSHHPRRSSAVARFSLLAERLLRGNGAAPAFLQHFLFSFFLFWLKNIPNCLCASDADCSIQSESDSSSPPSHGRILRLRQAHLFSPTPRGGKRLRTKRKTTAVIRGRAAHHENNSTTNQV